MKWSYDLAAADVAARLMTLRSRFGRTQQLVALGLSLALCTLALIAVSARMSLAPAPTAQPPALPAVGPDATDSALTTVPVPASSTAAAASPAQPQGAKFNCGTGTAETRYVVDRSGAIVFNSVDASQTALGTLPFRGSVQVYGTVTGRLTGNSDKWFAVRYGDKCAYVWADAATSRLSTTRPP